MCLLMIYNKIYCIISIMKIIQVQLLINIVQPGNHNPGLIWKNGLKYVVGLLRKERMVLGLQNSNSFYLVPSCNLLNQSQSSRLTMTIDK